MIGRLISGGMIIFVGISLYPEITKSVTQTSNMTNMTTFQAGSVVLSILPLFFVLAILGCAFSIIFSLLKDGGIVEYGDEYQEDYEKEDPDKKQTYEQYVKERLKVERMMKYGWFGKWI